MNGKNKDVLNTIAEYYGEKVRKFGGTPAGVDWNGEESQLIRFEQILKVVKPFDGFTLNDLGCGYGRLFSYMQEKFEMPFRYFGYDLSEDMVKTAKSSFSSDDSSFFRHIAKTDEMLEADYTVASGIFNVRLEHTEEEWSRYIHETLDIMNDSSKKGFSFNILTKYSDSEYMRDYLHYADPLFWFDYCKKNYSRNVALLHDYELYEFTILVRKQNDMA